MQGIQMAKKQISKVKGLKLEKQECVLEMARVLAKIPGVKAVVFGGLWDHDKADEHVDIDLKVCYLDRSPPATERLLKAAKQFTPNIQRFIPIKKKDPWKAIASLNVNSEKIDWHFQSLDKYADVIDEAKEGVFVWDKEYPPYGFPNSRYLGWIHHAVILHDPTHAFADLKKEVEQYPEALQKEIIQKCLWEAELFLPRAKKVAKRNEIFAAMNYITYVIVAITYILFALNKTYYFADKGAVNATDSFFIKPKNYAKRTINLLAHPGQGKALINSVKELEALFMETVNLISKN